jgi:hypothetical protein
MSVNDESVFVTPAAIAGATRRLLTHCQEHAVIPASRNAR